MIPSTEWMDDAACREVGVEIFYPESDKQPDYTAARRVCAGCPVRVQCAEYALEIELDAGRWTRHGIFGGLSPSQRWQIDMARRVEGTQRIAPRDRKILRLIDAGQSTKDVARLFNLHPDTVSRIVSRVRERMAS